MKLEWDLSVMEVCLKPFPPATGLVFRIFCFRFLEINYLVEKKSASYFFIIARACSSFKLEKTVKYNFMEKRKRDK